MDQVKDEKNEDESWLEGLLRSNEKLNDRRSISAVLWKRPRLR